MYRDHSSPLGYTQSAQFGHKMRIVRADTKSTTLQYQPDQRPKNLNYLLCTRWHDEDIRQA